MPMPNPRVRHAAVTTQVQIPLEGFFRQTVRGDLFLEKLDRSRALAAADHFAITFRRQHIDAQRDLVAFRIALHVESFHRRRIVMDHHRLVELAGEISFVRRAEVAAPFELVFQRALLRSPRRSIFTASS